MDRAEQKRDRRRVGSALLATLGLVAVAVPVAAGAHGGSGHDEEIPWVPETNFAAPVLEPKPCKLENHDRYVRRVYRLEGWKRPDFERYPGACERLRFAYGPIVIKPGQNDVLVEPVTIQSPRRNGYITRFKPNLVTTEGVPPVEDIHLHHGTWLSYPSYGGSVPFLASGEEKTIGPWPRGYGLPVKATDQWLLLHMVHNATSSTTLGWITYEMDFIPEAKGRRLGIKPAYPFWLDVRPSGYPVFNVERKYGGGDGKCTWPRQRCADFDPWGEQFVGQGEPGTARGHPYDDNLFELPERGGSMGRIDSFQGGTLIGLGGHLHPGGVADKIDLMRGGRSRRIFTSEAVYWNRRNPRKPGGPPTSWDMSMTVTGLPYWGVRVKPGDRLRINATYDTTRMATYENMGIAIGLIAPHEAAGEPTAPGLNPFKARRDRSRECRSVRKRHTLPIRRYRKRGLQARPRELCDRGIVTHGHLGEETENFGGPEGEWEAKPGPSTDQVNIAAFQYLPGDLSRRHTNGVPRVELGGDLRFTNLDGAGTEIFHTVTTCKFPCLGPTGAAFPIANGRTSAGRKLDLDSGELGIGRPAIGPAKQTLSWKLPVTREAGFKPGETVTYFCRIHPFMRGAFKVTK